MVYVLLRTLIFGRIDLFELAVFRNKVYRSNMGLKYQAMVFNMHNYGMWVQDI